MPLYPPGSGATLSDATPANVQPGVPDAGVATEASRDDHAHDASWSGVAPSASAPGDAAATGAAQGFNRRDHVHGREAVASQAEMEAGTEAAVRAVSPLRVKQAIDALGGAAAHIADATDAHDASAISFDDTGLGITAADVQTMGEQLDAAISAGGIPATIFDAAGDIIVASAADTAVRLVKGADGTFLGVAAGTVGYYTPAGGSEPDCYESFLAADVSITTAGTFQDIVSVSLPTGTYWVTGEGEATSASGSGTFVTMRIYDGATVWAAKGARCWAGDAGGAANPSVSARVVVSGTTTVKIQGTSNRSTGDTIFRDQSQANGTADKCSVMHALKITAA